MNVSLTHEAALLPAPHLKWTAAEAAAAAVPVALGTDNAGCTGITLLRKSYAAAGQLVLACLRLMHLAMLACVQVGGGAWAGSWLEGAAAP
jgi:hypothetical protein